MNIQKSAGVSDPLSIPGTFIFRLNSRSQVFEKGGLDQALHCLATKEVILLFLNIREGKGSAAVKSFFFSRSSRAKGCAGISNLKMPF